MGKRKKKKKCPILIILKLPMTYLKKFAADIADLKMELALSRGRCTNSEFLLLDLVEGDKLMSNNRNKLPGRELMRSAPDMKYRNQSKRSVKGMMRSISERRVGVLKSMKH